MQIAIAGDAIITRPVSQLTDPRATAIFDILRSADLAFMNCETVFHDYNEPGVWPSAESGMVAMRSSPAIAKELAWLNARLVATANNHSLDYSVGGLNATKAALGAAGIAYAGTGDDLAQARAAAYIDGVDARVALISMSSSATRESRASEGYDGVRGRPGLNPLGYHLAADRRTVEKIVEISAFFGLWTVQIAPDLWEVNPPGLHNTVTRYYVRESGAQMVLDEDDVAGNLRSIRNARSNADIVIAHVHNHEWDAASGSLKVPPPFMQQFARQAIESGADIVVAQGCHAPIRGIELHQGKPIFYDPGDLFLMTDNITRHPREFYMRYSAGLSVPIDQALPVDGNAALRAYAHPSSPAGGYFEGKAPYGAIITVDYLEGRLTNIKLHPFAGYFGRSAILTGVPLKPGSNQAHEILEKFAELSRAFNTEINIIGDVGHIALSE